MALIPPSSPTTGVDAVPDILCETCRSICKDSFIIQTYTSHGIDKNEASLEDVCVAAGKAREYFKWCTVKEFRAACQLGCHLCLMLRHRDMNQHYDLLVETEDEEEKSGKTSTLLKIACNESYDGSVEVTMCTVAEKEKELRPGFPFATYRVPMEPRDGISGPLIPIQLSKHPTAERATEIIKYWLERCEESHESCNEHYKTILKPDMRPTRLINVSNLDHLWLHTRDLRGSRRREYLTLSHCWPSDGNIFKLTESNVENLKRNIPMTQLSQTFKDAIILTNTLGYHYLWIDSICIIQDCSSDWAFEAERMAFVYGNAVLNLISCGPSGSSLFQSRNPLFYYPCKLSSQESSLYMVPQGEIREHIPAFKRAWIVQERMFSRRNVHFGLESKMGELLWECFNGHATETWSETIQVSYDNMLKSRSVRDVEHKAFFSRLLDALTLLNREDSHGCVQAKLDFTRMWERIVNVYSKTQLTYQSDKLVALSGMASMISQKASLDYVAGMWMFTLPAALLWISGDYGRPDPIPPRPKWRGASSWSWASVDEPITSDGAELINPSPRADVEDTQNYHARIVGCEIKPVIGRVAAFGEVEKAKLRIEGVLRSISDANRGYVDDPYTDGTWEFPKTSVKSVFFNPDITISPDVPLFYLTIFRGWAVDMYESLLWFKEEGLVLTPHHDGYIRVGYMRLKFDDDGAKGKVLEDFLWGDGKIETISIY